MNAQVDWGQCNIPVIESNQIKNNPQAPVEISSNFFESKANSQALFRGDVIFSKDDTNISTNELFYNSELEQIISQTPSTFTTSQSEIKSDSFEFYSQQQAGVFKQAEIKLFDTHRFINAETLNQVDDQHQNFKQFSYSSCEPNDKAWRLESEKISLNYVTGLGIAKHAKIHFFDVPIFYFPYFQFPIDDNRHSGFLMPSLAYASSTGGVIGVPYYWNIHPQLDTTFEFVNYAKRGFQTNAETRYLSSNHEGKLLTSYLEDEKTHTDRYFYQLAHQSKIAPNIKFSLLAQEVSEQDFFDDFSNHSQSDTPDFLERHTLITHNTKAWDNQLLWKNHQILDLTKTTDQRPYEQWPSISSNGHYQILNNEIALNLNNSFTQFKKTNSVEGERLIINPVISKRWSNSYSYIQPELSFSYSDYQLQNTDNSRQGIDRQLATFSVDSRLFFERIANQDRLWLQTLEPRLFYLNTPFQDQSAIPDFDSAELTPSYSNLFKTNRFTGGDRIGDTQQLTFGISSSLLSLNTGLELFRASIGKSFYQKTRKVQLPGISISSESESDLFLELSSEPTSGLKITGNVTQQTRTQFITEKTFSLAYIKDSHLINMSYRFKGDETETKIEQSELSWVKPINTRWKFFAKKQYSIADKHSVEQLLGLHYDSCCWGFSIIANEESNDDFSETNKSIYFQLSLKGLSNLGRDNQQILSDSIPGYSF